MNIYLVDYLGIHCGMHYYLQSFKSLLESGGNSGIEILSNFPNEKGEMFFRNQYNGNLFRKIFALTNNYFTFRRFVKSHRNDCLIFLSYGNLIEIPFILSLVTIQKHLIDVHEVVAQHEDQNSFQIYLFRSLYRNKIRNIIIHSERSRDFLKSFGFCGKVFNVPHVSYAIRKNVNNDILSLDVVNAFQEGKKNILFFGNLNYNKGVDILIDAVNKLTEADKRKLHVVIAGKNFDDSIYAVKPSDPSLFTFLVRHIDDNELIYLYEHTNFVAMPYRKTSQSGVLEMAFYFKKPVIATCIPYFKQVLSSFPSFGIIGEDSSLEDNYSILLKEALNSSNNFFTEDDYSNYMSRPEFKYFLDDFYNWISE